MKRAFKDSLTLKLNCDLATASNLKERLNAQASRFPFSTPHSLGLHLLTLGLQSMEIAPTMAANLAKVINPPGHENTRRTAAAKGGQK